MNAFYGGSGDESRAADGLFAASMNSFCPAVHKKALSKTKIGRSNFKNGGTKNKITPTKKETVQRIFSAVCFVFDNRPFFLTKERFPVGARNGRNR